MLRCVDRLKQQLPGLTDAALERLEPVAELVRDARFQVAAHWPV